MINNNEEEDIDESRTLLNNLYRPITILNTLHRWAQLFLTVMVSKWYHYVPYFTNQDIEGTCGLNNQPKSTHVVTIRDHEDPRSLEFYY